MQLRSTDNVNRSVGGSDLLCEVCDDVIVFGTTEEEFLINLEQVFQRLEEKNITLNPKKCRTYPVRRAYYQSERYLLYERQAQQNDRLPQACKATGIKAIPWAGQLLPLAQ